MKRIDEDDLKIFNLENTGEKTICLKEALEMVQKSKEKYPAGGIRKRIMRGDRRTGKKVLLS